MTRTRTAERIVPEILGVAEIADVSGLKADTITKYRSLGKFPAPDWTTARQDLWSRETILRWLRERRTT